MSEREEAELVLCVGDRAGYHDGDVVHMWTRRYKRQWRAGQIAHPVRAPKYPDGGIRLESSCRYWYEYTRQFLFEQIDATTVRRTEMATGVVELQRYRVDAYLRELVTVRKGQVFGSINRRRWYGGRESYAAEALDRVWRAIEAFDGVQWSDVRWMEPERHQHARLLWLRAFEVSDARALELVSPLTAGPAGDDDPDPVTIARRAYQVAWRYLPGMTRERIAQIENPRDLTDHRDLPVVDTDEHARARSAARTMRGG